MRPVFAVILVAILASTAWAGDSPLAPIPRTERLPRPETRRKQPTSQPVAPPFIIGIWYPPAASMAVWKARGLNTAVGYEHQSNQVSLEEWSSAAVNNGLFLIRQPAVKISDDLNEPYLLAWMHTDEPDLKGIDPPVLAEEYARWKKEAPKLPVFVSVSGGGVLFRKTPRALYREYFESADWIANDFYPVTGWNQPTWIPRLGETVDLCRKLSHGKPQFAFIETSSQQLAWLPKETRGVTPDELRAEIWHAVIHGVKGIIYFPQQFNPFQYDATPSDVSVEMARQNRILENLAPVLALPANPEEIHVSVAAPLEAAWRKTEEGRVYVIVLNLSNQSLKNQTVQFKGIPDGKASVLNSDVKSLTIENKVLIDNFDPYFPRLYILETSKSTPK